ncbi:putative pectinesterase 11 [Selaginella moellendorffii]|uniref:putative pectinesterase 11 n=1 Tax=Selaginella moellendorffii TaxID=88036 RepID=UPI000D1D0B17|nr:putative pectinesterase 11 [Selaginella moellendorffii]|eukprot:XP_024531936.1 putative pectinesterase 11 [Selaginella moellendorffii]
MASKSQLMLLAMFVTILLVGVDVGGIANAAAQQRCKSGWNWDGHKCIQCPKGRREDDDDDDDNHDDRDNDGGDDDDTELPPREALSRANSDKVKLYVGPDEEYKTITEAINAVPLQNKQRYIINVAAGVYREKIIIPATKDFITLVGNPDAKFSTNDAPFAYSGAVGGQAVALRVSGEYAAFYDCFITSSQDTLYDQKGRHYYKRSYIQGNVDFIFGQGRALFEDCLIISNARSKSGSITAQSKFNATLDSGYSIYNSYIGGTGLVHLGRPWKEYASVVFVNNYLDEVVNPTGWDQWAYNPAAGTAFFAEHGNFGPGADSTRRVNWIKQLTSDQAYEYSDIKFIDGQDWLYLE